MTWRKYGSYPVVLRPVIEHAHDRAARQDYPRPASAQWHRDHLHTVSWLLEERSHRDWDDLFPRQPTVGSWAHSFSRLPCGSLGGSRVRCNPFVRVGRIAALAKSMTRWRQCRRHTDAGRTGSSLPSGARPPSRELLASREAMGRGALTEAGVVERGRSLRAGPPLGDVDLSERAAQPRAAPRDDCTSSSMARSHNAGSFADFAEQGVAFARRRTWRFCFICSPKA